MQKQYIIEGQKVGLTTPLTVVYLPEHSYGVVFNQSCYEQNHLNLLKHDTNLSDKALQYIKETAELLTFGTIPVNDNFAKKTIFTKYMPPTNTKPARVKASMYGTNSSNITTFQFSNTKQEHIRSFQALYFKIYGEYCPEFTMGDAETGYIFLFDL